MKRYIPARIVLFPGLGADPRMFDRQKRRFGDDLQCPAWLQPEAGESFEAYARRWAEELKPEPGDDRPLFLGGVSFGGMVALRIAEFLKPKAVILIGSCRSRQARPPRWRVARRIGNMIPDVLLGRRTMALGGLWVSLLDQLDSEHRSLLIRMGADSDPRLVRWSGHACADWDFDEHTRQGFPPVHQIHGRHDAIIPLHAGDPDTVIHDGRHILHFSHPHTVERFIMDVVRRYVDD
ncbi:MAG: alpha/beta hydrolase [Phycisphaerales bacterium]